MLPDTRSIDFQVCLLECGYSLPFITATAEGPKHIDATLSRAQFEELSSDLFDRLRPPVQKALDDAKVDLKNLQEVVLVGGSTRMPGVQNLVKEMTNKEPNVSVNPDEVVALGAAVQVLEKLICDTLTTVDAEDTFFLTYIAKDKRDN